MNCRFKRYAPTVLFICLAATCTLAPATTKQQGEAEQAIVTLVADDWCPQHCQNDARRKGYIVDIVWQALRNEGVAFNIVYRPWTRALRLTEQGVFDGLLTPTVNGYPQFFFHNEAVGYQQYCFYVNADSTWTFNVPSDLLGKRVAYLKESGFGKLDTYMATNKGSIRREEFVGYQGITHRIFEFLAAGRADTVIMTSDVFDMNRRFGEARGMFKSAGCLPNEKLSVGLSKVHPERSRWIATKLDNGIVKLRQSGQLKSILAEYGIEQWPVGNR